MTSDESGFFVDLGLKIIGFFSSFVAGIVAATWVVAKKVSSVEADVAAVEADVSAVAKRQEVLQSRIDAKLDSLHARIDCMLQDGRRGQRPEDSIMRSNIAEINEGIAKGDG